MESTTQTVSWSERVLAIRYQGVRNSANGPLQLSTPPGARAALGPQASVPGN